MIVTGASLLGQILTNRTSSGLAAKAAPAEPARPAPREPTATLAAVTMSLSTFDALFALTVSSRGAGPAGAPADKSAPAALPSPGLDAGAQRRGNTLAGGQTVVDPDLVRAMTAALESRTSMGGGAGLASLSQRSAGGLETAYLT